MQFLKKIWACKADSWYQLGNMGKALSLCFIKIFTIMNDSLWTSLASSSFIEISFCLEYVFYLFIFIIYLYIYIFSTVQHGDPVTHTLHCFFSHYMFHHKWLDRVPRDKQQDPIANPSQRLHSAPIYPKLPVPPLPPWQPQVYSASPWFSFLWKCSFVPYIRF